jgi:hypothetical protein
MPLRQGRGIHQIEDAVVFMMRDTQTGEIVPCTISAAALSRLAGRAGVRLEDAFDENRLTIEAIASRMYDAGEKKPANVPTPPARIKTDCRSLYARSALSRTQHTHLGADI